MSKTMDEAVSEFVDFLLNVEDVEGVSPAVPVKHLAKILQTMLLSTTSAASLQAKLQQYEEQFPCDGGCMEGPEETCSAHGRPPKELWEMLEKANKKANGEPYSQAYGIGDEKLAMQYVISEGLGLGFAPSVLDSFAHALKDYKQKGYSLEKVAKLMLELSPVTPPKPKKKTGNDLAF